MSRFFRTAGDSESSSEEEEELMSEGSGDEAPSKPARQQVPLSRFLKREGSDSSSGSSDSEEDQDGEDSDEAPKPTRTKPQGSRLPRADDSDDSDSDDGEPRAFKSARDKRVDEMQAIGKSIENALKIGDWVATSNEFDKLVRLVQRQTNISEPVPPFWFKTILSLDSSIKNKDASKKLNASNNKSFNAMKQKVKKSQKEYEEPLRRYQEDPEKFESEYQASLEPVTAPTPARPPPSQKVDRPEAEDEEDAEKKFQTVGKGGKATLYTPEQLFKVLAQVNESRGKKNTDRVEQVRTLEQLLAIAATTYQKIRVLLTLVSARFDYNPSATHMPLDIWTSAQKEFDQLVKILVTEPKYSVREIVDEEYDDSIERTPETEKDGIVQIRGSIISFVDRLDDEFTRSLQNIDPHGTEYIERLKDEKVLYQSICKAEAYCEKTKQDDALARVMSRRLEHIYCKPDAVVEALEQTTDPDDAVLPEYSLSSSGSVSSLVHEICVVLYKTKNSLIRTRAMLCHIYHYALHNDFHTARDMLLMSHLQESIHAADVATQILYNRATVQLGLCAFRCGLIKESQQLLHDIFATQRVKELLAQGLHQQRYVTLTPEQEKAERNRQIPFHMHINTELAEAAFLGSSMLVEIPLLASLDSDEAKRKIISKPFRRLLDHANRQVFNGPPENTRDHIMQASKALQDGDWEKSRDLIQGIAIWNLMPEAKAVKEMLAKRIQEDGLRTYLFSNAPCYTTLSLSLLSRIFSLPVRQVNSIVSKMIWNEELAASLDQAAGVVVFHRVEPTRLQHLAVTLSDKVAALVEQNEKALDNKLGGTTAWNERGDGKGAEKRGDGAATGERRTARTGGTRGGLRGRGRGARFAQGLGGAVRA